MFITEKYNIKAIIADICFIRHRYLSGTVMKMTLIHL